MSLINKLFHRDHPWCTYCQWAIVALIWASVLWRGGKSLDMTWALTGVASLAVLTSHFSHIGKGSRNVPLLLWSAVMGFTTLTVLSYFYSTTQNYGLDEVLRTGALGLLLIWVIREIHDSEDNDFTNRILRTIARATLIACCIGLLVYILQPVNRFVGTFFDSRFHTDYWPNAWADFVLLTWPLVAYFTFTDFSFDSKNHKSRIEFLLRIAMVGLVLGCLFLSYSRGATLTLIAQLGIWAGLIYKKTRANFPMQKILPTAIVITVASALVFVTTNTLRNNLYEVQDLSDKVTLQSSEGGSSVSERFTFWGQSINLAMQKPLLGWGPYSFRFVQPTLQRGVLETSDHPHNVLLKILVERGILSALVFVLVVGLVLYRASVQLLADRTDEQTLLFSLRVVLFVGLIGVVLHNMIDFNLQFVGIALPFWLMLGILMTHLEIDSLRSIPRSVARGVEVLLAVLLLVVALYEGGYLVTSSIGRRAESFGDHQKALMWYERSDGEMFSRDLLLSRARLDTPTEALSILKKYRERNAVDYRSYRIEGDRTGKNVTAFTKALEGGRWNDLGISRGLLESTGDVDAMKASLDALLLKYADAIGANTHFIALSPNVEEFIVICNRLATLYPKEAPKYQVMAAKADHHAQIEREKIKSRPPGFLW